MELVPQESKIIEFKKITAAQDTTGTSGVRKNVAEQGSTQESSPMDKLQLTSEQPPAAEQQTGETKGNLFSSSAIYNKLSEFVESGIFDFTVFAESVRQASQNATTSIWSILRKTLDEDDKTDEDEILQLLGILMKTASNFTYEHSQRVMEWSVSLAQQLQLSKEQVENVRRGALFRDIGKTGLFFADSSEDEQKQVSDFLRQQILEFRVCGEFHDIGKLEIPRELVNKTSKLSDDEYEIMKQHPIIGEALLKPIKCLQHILPAVRNHHERWDGLGYPDGLKGDEIALEARIVALVDSFDAMISDRPYRKALKVEIAISELVKNSGTQFDPVLVPTFIKIVRQDQSLTRASQEQSHLPLKINGLGKVEQH